MKKKDKFKGFDWMKVDHTKKRVKERYGITLNDDDILEVVWKIQNQKSIRAWRASDSRRKHIVKIKGREILFVYDKNRKIPVTALPIEEGDYDHRPPGRDPERGLPNVHWGNRS